jgi:aryl-alcohol dehydrogenase-like predicted oxidoreductase
MALAWLITQKPYIVPIPGMGSTKYLEENIDFDRDHADFR